MERTLMPACNWDEMPYEPCGGAAPSARRRYSSGVAIMKPGIALRPHTHA
jgi:hypothetical protein